MNQIQSNNHLTKSKKKIYRLHIKLKIPETESWSINWNWIWKSTIKRGDSYSEVIICFGTKFKLPIDFIQLLKVITFWNLSYIGRFDKQKEILLLLWSRNVEWIKNTWYSLYRICLKLTDKKRDLILYLDTYSRNSCLKHKTSWKVL